MRLHALDIKLLRDLRRLWAQALAIALVLGCGVAVFITSLGMVGSLEATRADYYDRNRFGDVFASTRRAPLWVADDIRAIPGVNAAEPRISGLAVLDLPGRAETAQGRIVSLPVAREPAVNLPLLTEGRFPEEEGEVTVNDRFAKANGFTIGSSFTANLGGRKRDLTITGMARSPEFVYTLPPGGMMPDNQGYGILFLPEPAAAAAWDMQGAFNDIAITLRRDASEAQVIDRVDAILAPWGGTGAYGRKDQISNAFVDSEIEQLHSMARMLPPVFFGIAAFLVNMVLTRIVALERSEIGLLKALGYRNREIAAHYIMFAVAVAAIGVAIGCVTGAWLARGMSMLYVRFYDFPWLVRPGGIDTYAEAALIGIAAAALGALRAAWQAAQLAPAVAMAPPAPMRFRRSLIDRAARALRVSQPTIMILRSLTRWPVRSALTVVGLGFGVSVLVASSFFYGSMDTMIDLAFDRSNRQNAILILQRAEPLSVVEDARHLPGVLAAEPELAIPAVLRFGSREKTTAITARPPGADLTRVLDAERNVVELPPDGLLLSQQLARQLGVRRGDVLSAELTGRRAGTVELRVAGIVAQVVGLGAYMQLDALAAVLREPPQATSINIALDAARTDAFHAAVKGLPSVASAVMLTEVKRSFMDTINQNIGLNTAVYVTMAVLITVGLAYNAARIQLSERSRELASLRILGFTRTEVSYVLVGETALLSLLAQPVGWAIGAGIAWSVVHGFESDLYRLPLTLNAGMFARASLIALAATFAAALVVRRRLDRADLVAVMKTRE